MIILLASIVALFVAVIVAGVFLQPRWERNTAASSPDDAWNAAGFAGLRAQGFQIYRIVPTTRMLQSEFIVQDPYGREFCRYVSALSKSATIQYAGATLRLYIQASGINRTMYSGKVGGTSDRSIVIRDNDRVVAEIWRQNALPPMEYRCVCAGETILVHTGGWHPTSPGTIEREGRQIGAFRRPSLCTRNLLIAFQSDFPTSRKPCYAASYCCARHPVLLLCLLYLSCQHNSVLSLAS